MKKLLLLTSCLLVGACGAGEMAAFTAVGVGGTVANHVNKGSYLTADDTVDAVIDAYKQDENTSFDLN